MLSLRELYFRSQNRYQIDTYTIITRTNGLLFGPGLVATIGAQHKKQRKMLTPAFSVKYLRGMTPMFVSIAREVSQFDNDSMSFLLTISMKLETHISSLVKGRSQEVDVTAWLNRFALEAIGRGGMGHSFGSMSKATEFSDATKELA